MTAKKLIKLIKAFQRDRKKYFNFQYKTPVFGGDREFYIVTETELLQFSKMNTKLLKALAEILKGEGRYDMDQLKHASNTIEDMKLIAKEAIKKITK